MTTHLVRYQLAVSIDGLIAPTDGSVDWLAPYAAMAGEIMTPFMESIGGLIMGRATFDQIQAQGGWPFDQLPTVVLSASVPPAMQPHTKVCSTGPQAALDSLLERMPADQPSDIWLVGGGQTAAGFLDANLIDRLELTTVPVILGSGRPLFQDPRGMQTFELLSSQTIAQGVVTTVYAKQSG